jgi:membrane carboxypeptidase/penicillin-binding protein PbpC
MHNVTGLTGAAPIWHEVMRGLLQGHPDHPFARPQGLIQVEVCDLSGRLATPLCPRTHMEWFIAGTEPTQADQTFQQVWIDTLTNSLADNSTPLERRKSITVLDLPLEAQTWARAQGIPLLTDFSLNSGSPLAANENPLLLLSPPPNTTYRIDPNFDTTAQQLKVEVAAGQDISRITLWVDGTLLAAPTSPPYQVWWTLSAGGHRFWAEGVDAVGRAVKSEVSTISVIDR